MKILFLSLVVLMSISCSKFETAQLGPSQSGGDGGVEPVPEPSPGPVPNPGPGEPLSYYEVTVQGAGKFMEPAPIMYDVKTATLIFKSFKCTRTDGIADPNENKAFFKTANGIRIRINKATYFPGSWKITVFPKNPVRCEKR